MWRGLFDYGYMWYWFTGLPDSSYPNIFVPRRFVPSEFLTMALTLTWILFLTQKLLTLTPNPNINSNSNPNSRYLTLTLFKNAGYGTPGYEEVGVRNVWHQIYGYD